MKILIINAHQYYPFSEGKLNQSLAELAGVVASGAGHEVKFTTLADEWDVAEEIAKHQWADVIILQSPVNWMGVSWMFKKYMDEVYTAGMGGELCDGDGRHRRDPSLQYGTGGTLKGKRYMLSLTFNAPANAFDDPAQFLFEGRSVDDLFMPTHMNFRFFGMTALPTFACFDVMKNPQIEQDLKQYREHLLNVLEEN
ncbi:NAD(P)H-dependent oxidoreductase [Shewanella corallii]|uniref:NAD(P)H-dependent oxidoreductase n=1 Tax=Shewanella corallii TaxID=560080 RepID=A0ABT0N3H5_9GAMM|nr:NAD(P)H-dependent oxidoreductase [Shewanella corallii]MCL2912994.1 NAD(P)H-dependent oxidoreductase [Shewanella corallii]